MQRAADAAALAGVVWAADNTIDSSCTPAVAKWECVAKQTAAKNGMADGVNDVTRESPRSAIPAST